MNELNAIINRIIATDESAGVLATLVTVAGSSYRRPGARLLLPPTGPRLGSISGGCLEEDVVARARRVASTGIPELVTYDTTAENDAVWGVGLGCHGVVQVLLEKLPAAPAWAQLLAAHQRGRRPTDLAVVWRAVNSSALGTRLAIDLGPAIDQSVFRETVPAPVSLVIFGAGDDAQPLVRFAKDLGWHLTVADPRREYATTARFPTADAIVIAPSTDLVGSVFGVAGATSTPAESCAVVMTHHYAHDVPVLRDLLPRNIRYVGLLGPKQRAEKILADLGRDGLDLSVEQRSRLHAPVGLDIGAETPEEVALSIIAEIRATLAGRDARPLRERNRPIHE